MNTIVARVLRNEGAKAQTAAHPLTIISMFCGLGLLASLCMISYGLDVSAGFF